jgi:hypothetical protein
LKVFSSANRRVRAKCASPAGLIARSTSSSGSVPSGCCGTGCGWIEPSTAAPPPSNL